MPRKPMLARLSPVRLRGGASVAVPSGEGMAPFNSIPPQFTGKLAVGETLTGIASQWMWAVVDGEVETWFSVPDTVTRRWQRATSLWGTYTDISGATGNDYTLVTADIGCHVRPVDTATNAYDSTEGYGCGSMVVAETLDPTLFNEVPELIKSFMMSGEDGSEYSPGSSLRMTTFCKSTDKTEYICGTSELAGGVLGVGKSSIPANGGTAVHTSDRVSFPASGLYDPRAGGFHVHNGRIIQTARSYYPAGEQAINCTWIAEDLLTQMGSYQEMRDGVTPCDYYAGSMAKVPAAVQAACGGPAIAGLGSAAIASQRSCGPCAGAFDPDDIGVIPDAPVIPIIYFDTSVSANSLPWTGVCARNDVWTLADTPYVNGIMAGYDTIIFATCHGFGDYAYGTPTWDPRLHGTPDGSGNQYAFNPRGGVKGTNAYPWRWQLLCYKLSACIAAVDKRSVMPYAVIPLPGAPNGYEAREILGGFFDPDTNQLEVGWNYANGHMAVNVYQLGDPP